MIYLAVPYSHDSPAVRHERFEAVNKYAAYLMEQGLQVFSPISHSHPIQEHFKDPKTTWEFWAEHDIPFLKMCSHVHVLCLDGWKESVGVTDEIRIADELSIPVVFIPPNYGDYLCQR